MCMIDELASLVEEDYLHARGAKPGACRPGSGFKGSRTHGPIGVIRP